MKDYIPIAKVATSESEREIKNLKKQIRVLNETLTNVIKILTKK